MRLRRQTLNYDRLIQSQLANFTQNQIDAAKAVGIPIAVALINSRCAYCSASYVHCLDDDDDQCLAVMQKTYNGCRGQIV